MGFITVNTKEEVTLYTFHNLSVVSVIKVFPYQYRHVAIPQFSTKVIIILQVQSLAEKEMVFFMEQVSKC